MRAPDPDPEPEANSQPRTPRTHAPALELAAFATMYVLWGSTFLAVRVGVATLPPFLLAGTRFLTAGAILYALLRLRGAAAPTRREWGQAATAGGLMIVGGNGLVAWASQHLASNMAALLLAAIPLFTVILDWVRPRGTRPGVPVLAGVAVGAVGMALLLAPAGGSTAAAMAAVLVSALCWAIGTLTMRVHGGGAPGPMATAQQMLVGGVVLTLVAALHGDRPAALASAGAHSLAALAYLTLLGSLVGFSVFGWLVRVSTPARVSTVAYVNPVVAVVLGWALLGERLGARALAGAGAPVGAVVLMSRRR